MKKNRVIKRKPSLKTRWPQRSQSLQLKAKSLNLAHPVAKASYTWSILSDQLCDILGASIHHQWFKNVRPVVISHNVLILEVPNHFHAQWIHIHYQEVVDLLISALDKRLSSFFISQSEKHRASDFSYKRLPESPTSKVKRQHEDE